MHLSDANKFVDLENSEWDKKTSKPELGLYNFKKKVYIDYRGVAYPKPGVYLYWGNTHPYWEADEKNKYPGLERVKVGHRFWPEGVCPNANGEYIFKDAILVSIPTEQYLAQRRWEINQARLAPEIAKKQIAEEYHGMGIDLSDEQISAMAGTRPE